MSADVKDFLAGVLLFKDLPARELEKVAKLFTVKEFPKYHVVFQEGSAGDLLYIIQSGVVKISKEAADGRVKTLALLSVGEIFGEMSVLSEETRSANAETLTETKAAVIKREDFQGLVEKSPIISLHIIRTLIDRLYQADRQIKNLALGNSRAKIADILLQLSQEFGGEGEDGAKVGVRLTHQELADLAGLARETTTKLLNEFVKDEAILLKDREIEILNKAKLQQWVM
jgi:CRP/FNR family transcriptional regulator, cyclic AMP receptor protein